MGGEEGGRCRVGSVGKDEEGGCGVGRGHREMTRHSDRQTVTPDKPLLWTELIRLSGHCIYRMERKLAITFHVCGLHIAVLCKPAHIKAECLHGLFPGSGVLISS